MNFFKDNHVDQATDNFTNYLNKFAEEFLPIINNDKKKFKEIIEDVQLKNWRFLNREVRKACDQYCTDNRLMNHADFQKKWFYEGVMIGRKTHGAKAEWLDDTTPTVSKTIPKGKTVTVDLADSTIREEDKGTRIIYPYVKNGWMHYKDGACRVGRPTPEELAAEHKSRSGK